MLAYDFRSGAWVPRTVAARHENVYRGPVITIGTDAGTLRTTVYHPFWVIRGEDLANRPRPEHIRAAEEELVDRRAQLPGRWVDAVDLLPGDVLFLRDGREVILRTVNLYRELQNTYNFAVGDLHNYAVGAPGILVHNNCGDAVPRGGSLRSRLGDPPAGMRNPQAHHDLPQAPRFHKHWERAGLDIDDPAYGRWVEGGPVGDHQKWSKAFNDEWDAFFDDYPDATREQILDHMDEIRNDPRFQ